MAHGLRQAGVAEQADARDLKSLGGNTVRVRPPSPAPSRRKRRIACGDFFQESPCALSVAPLSKPNPFCGLRFGFGRGTIHGGIYKDRSKPEGIGKSIWKALPKGGEKPILRCVVLFAICAVARLIEYFVIRTDETFLSENVLHKVFGIAVLAIVLHVRGDRWKSVGFVKDRMVPDILKGFLLGGCCFFAAYFIECLILYQANQNVSLAFYISGFTLNGEATRHDGALLLFLCIALNVINVWMEEGVFRGLSAACTFQWGSGPHADHTHSDWADPVVCPCYAVLQENVENRPIEAASDWKGSLYEQLVYHRYDRRKNIYYQ